MSALGSEPELRRAAALFGAGRLDEARAIATAVATREPRSFIAAYLLTAIAARTEQWEDCVAFATRALEIDPRHAEALANRGIALRMLGRHVEALADYERALALAPGAADTHNNRGVALAALNRHAEAIESYTAALAIKPAYERARFNRALSELVTGDFAAGWRDHESRWTGSEMHHGPRILPGRAWDGREDLHGKTLLLYAEQGLGDAIQFARYATLAHRRGARVLLEVHAPLKELLAAVEGVDAAFALGEPLPAFDLHCALMSLPLAFDTRPDSIPAAVPYLAAPEAHVERWRGRLAAIARPRVGLAWSGSRTLRNDANRSIPLALLAPLARPGRSLVAVQKDIRDADRAAVASLGITAFEQELHDFRDTAALVAACDAIVSVDTSIAHLAGAMGRTVFVLLPFSPDWRWLLDRDDSPWYPTARLFRQERIGDWDAVIAKLGPRLRGDDSVALPPVK